MRCTLAAVAVCAVVTGCGSSDDDGKSAATRSAPEREAGEVALRYVRALGARDWAKMCDTRTRTEQQELARLGGSCERAMAAAFRDKPVSLFSKVRVHAVRIEGDRAGIDLVQPGQTEPALTLVAVRDGDRWLLEDVPDDQAP